MPATFVLTNAIFGLEKLEAKPFPCAKLWSCSLAPLEASPGLFLSLRRDFQRTGIWEELLREAHPACRQWAVQASLALTPPS